MIACSKHQKGDAMQRKLIFTITLLVGFNTSINAGEMGDKVNNNKGFYLEGAFGGAYRDVTLLHSLSYIPSVAGHPAGPLVSRDKIANQLGWTVGGNLGYEFNNLIATEFGVYYIQKTEYIAQPGSIYQNRSGQLSHFGYSNELFYLAPKITFLRFNHFNAYVKFGIGLNHYNFIGQTTFTYAHGAHVFFGTWKHPSFNGVAPLVAVGASRDIGKKLYVAIQYMRFGTSWNTVKLSSQDQIFEHRGFGNSWQTPASSAIDLFQASIGYRF